MITVLAVFNLPIRSTIVSDDSLLKAQWVSGYCDASNSSIFHCPVSVASVNDSVLQISSKDNISTILFQLSSTYADLLSHSAVTYNISVGFQTAQNVTFKFSQVVDSAYYSSAISSVHSKVLVPKSVSGSIDIDLMRQNLSVALNTPTRIEIDLKPSTTQVSIGIDLIATTYVSLGNLVATNGLGLSGLIGAIGAYYWAIPRVRAMRLLGTGLMIASVIAISSIASIGIFRSWPPLNPTFSWLFSFGVILGLGILWVYFVMEKSVD